MGSLRTANWTWSLPASPAALWPILSDTARFNEAASLPKYEVEETPQPDGSVRRIGRGRLMGRAVEWDENPYQWVHGRSFSQLRQFRGGPWRQFGIDLRLEPDGAGTRAHYAIAIEPQGLVGNALVRMGLLAKIGGGIEKMVRGAADFVNGQRPLPFDFTPAALPEGARERAAALVVRMEASAFGHGLSARLADHLLTAQEVDLLRIRPLKLARMWQCQPRAAVELCLEGARAGLLRLQWSLLCPRCQGAKMTVDTLEQLPHGAHCASCNISYDGNFSNNVEVSFQPAPSIRTVSAGEFCVSGPYATPHVLVQQTLAPGETRRLAFDLPPGRYRLRTIDPGTDVELVHPGGAFPTVLADRAGAEGGAPGGAGEIVLENRDSRPRTLLVETRAWAADALTAHQVTTMQAFRALFSEEVLGPGQDFAIDNVTLLFTDLEGSTALYERIGDSPAYALVRDHFDFLGDVVRVHDGALVKTIGDSVMAAFAAPANAVRAALEMQRRVHEFNARHGGEVIVIKMGVHGGACIAVTLNERFDYFGSTVNLAARMEGQSHGGDIILSERLANDPSVAPLLDGLDVTSEAAPLKGFAEAIPYRRIVMPKAARAAA
jgi:class 3 adenylate cyclase